MLLNFTNDINKIERIHLNFIKKKTLTLKTSDLENLDLDDNNVHWRIIIKDNIKYIKNILSLPHINKKLEKHTIKFKLIDDTTINNNINNDLELSFDKILQHNINTLSPKELILYKSVIT